MKTAEMARLELLDWERRISEDPAARKRDIREIIQAAFAQAGGIVGAAEIVGVTTSTLSIWINRYLHGEIQNWSRVTFRDLADEDPLPVAAGTAAE